MKTYYYYWIALLVFIVDWITKKVIATNLQIGDKISVIGNFFVITSHRNKGAAFGILEGQRIFFLIITVIVVAGIIWYIYVNRKSGKPMLLSALGLVLGGAVGNFLDRALYGEVVDFLQFTFGSYIFPIFNVADSAIVCGVGLILLDTILSMKEDSKKEKEGNDGSEQSV
ncbi:signal peptidase II [Paenibacillus sp. GCM10012307]|uniref:Lipoprotein signal peptidase n=1 Tax=Paenibacillus roseus TaxID=2798579 RepID=A0A934MQI1_9BACL|nr:signal peptidase II [Paenibacillus roseus]MBJ6363176.1 signal peptidase II [Paenibacillus roseus]